MGRTTRNGLNFTERGFGVRAALGCSDRGHTAVSQLKPGQIDWDEIFGKEGSRWFHTGGIFCALSETTPEVAKEAMVAARKHGVMISYDLNYRDSLWKSIGGKARATEVNRELASYVDVMIGNEEDFTAALGFEIEGVGEDLGELDSANFRKMIEKAVATFRTSERWLRRCVMRRRRVSTTGARCARRTRARSMRPGRCLIWRSSIVLAAGTRLLRG